MEPRWLRNWQVYALMLVPLAIGGLLWLAMYLTAPIR